jgi:hypothetical protein
MNLVWKWSLEKKKKKRKKRKTSAGSLSAQKAQTADPTPRAGPLLPLSFFFFTETLIAGPACQSLPLPLPFFFLPLPPLPHPSRAAARFPPRPAASPPSFLPLAVI